MLNLENVLRVVRFRPYRASVGNRFRPQFRLTTWDTGRTGFGGKNLVGYRLSMGGGDKRSESVTGQPAVWVTVFRGEDFACSPLHAIDSDMVIASIMGFLTLRPGDTDSDYFADYTPEQIEFAQEWAEALSCEVSARFPESS